MTNLKISTLGAALAGALLLSGAAQALSYGTLNATNTGVTPGGDGVAGGVFSFKNDGGGTFTTPLLTDSPAGTFIGFCLDIKDGLGSGSVPYLVSDVADAPLSAGAMGGPKAADIALLVGGVLGGSFSNVAVYLNTDFKAHAFQLAIWEIINETSGSYGVGAGEGTWDRFDSPFGPASAAVALQANSYLALMTGATAAKNLYSLINGTKQDFLVQAVPIPAAAWLLGSGLLGLFGLARRKTAVATA